LDDGGEEEPPAVEGGYEVNDECCGFDEVVFEHDKSSKMRIDEIVCAYLCSG
jgi:hypothetical protein